MIPKFLTRMLALKQIKFGDGTIEIIGRKGVIVPVDTLIFAQKRLEELLGRETAQEFMYNLGKAHTMGGMSRYSGSKEILKSFFDRLPATGNPMLEFGQQMMKYTGWGTCTIEKIDKNRDKMVVKAENSPLAIEYLKRYGKSEGPVCHYLAGMLCGPLEAVEKSEYEYKEIGCMATGKSRECIFEFVRA
jgi:predicted hydrocarbon binding protein